MTKFATRQSETSYNSALRFNSEKGEFISPTRIIQVQEFEAIVDLHHLGHVSENGDQTPEFYHLSSHQDQLPFCRKRPLQIEHVPVRLPDELGSETLSMYSASISWIGFISLLYEEWTLQQRPELLPIVKVKRVEKIPCLFGSFLVPTFEIVCLIGREYFTGGYSTILHSTIFPIHQSEVCADEKC